MTTNEAVQGHRPEALKERLTFDVGAAELAEHGEDSLLVDTGNLVFGVFDGMGSGANPKFASQLASDIVHEHLKDLEVDRSARHEEILDDVSGAMKQAFKLVREHLAAEAPGEVTTATVVKIVPYAKGALLVWGNSGDSRMFLKSGNDGSIDAVTTDQSDGNIIHNGLGHPDQRMEDEFGVVALEAGDKIMLCSDGITGDWEHQFLSDRDMEWAFDVGNAAESAERFVEVSKKQDDKSVIVINIHELQPIANDETTDNEGGDELEEVGEGEPETEETATAPEVEDQAEEQNETEPAAKVQDNGEVIVRATRADVIDEYTEALKRGEIDGSVSMNDWTLARERRKLARGRLVAKGVLNSDDDDQRYADWQDKQ